MTLSPTSLETPKKQRESAVQVGARSVNTPALLSLSAFASGVSRSLSLIVRHSRHGALAAAMVGDQINVRHPACTAWLEARGLDPAALPFGLPAEPARVEDPVAIRRKDEDGQQPHAESHEVRAGVEAAPDMDEIRHLTVEQVVQRHGSLDGFSDWVDVRKRISETHRIDLQNAEKVGRLISRDLVRTHAFGAIDNANRRLLQDAPRTLARRISGCVKAGEPTEDIEKTVRDIISSHLRHVKTTAARVLREQRLNRRTSHDHPAARYLSREIRRSDAARLV